MNETNWIIERVNKTVSDVDKKNLELAHKFETNLIKQGYRWYKLNERVKILIEYDNEGNLTEKGKKQLKRAQKLYKGFK